MDRSQRDGVAQRWTDGGELGRIQVLPVGDHGQSSESPTLCGPWTVAPAPRQAVLGKLIHYPVLKIN